MTATEDDAHPEPVTVFVSSDAALVAVAESLLEEADIEYFAKGEGIQDLFAGGRIGTVNPVVGPVELQVAGDDADQAMAILRDLSGSSRGPGTA